jgi:hypothetical protein
MGEIDEELGRAAKVFLWSLWQNLDPATRQRIEAVLFPVLKIAVALAIMFLVVWVMRAIIRDLAKASSGNSALVGKLLATWGRLSARRGRIRPAVIPAVALLLVAVFGTWPYNFYILMRIVVCVTAAWMAIQLHANRRFLWESGLILVAVLFNPVAPFHFPRETWAWFNVLAALALVPGILGFLAIPHPSSPPIDMQLEESRYCHHCGCGIVGTDLFCRRCGISLRTDLPVLGSTSRRAQRPRQGH